MAWTSPMTAVANTAFTAAQFNLNVRDNLNETAAAKATTAGRIFVATGTNAIAERAVSGATVSASQTTASTGYTNLTTSGPAVTVTTGTQALVMVTCALANDTAGGRALAAFAISGATTDASSDADAIMYDENSAGRIVRCTGVAMRTGLTAGSNTFTMQYRVSAGTGTFSLRHIVVIAL